MKKLTILFALVLIPALVFAKAVEVNGVWYSFSKDQQAEVVYNPEGGYTGDIVIPEHVTMIMLNTRYLQLVILHLSAAMIFILYLSLIVLLI
jgi:hypothetical protein